MKTYKTLSRARKALVNFKAKATDQDSARFFGIIEIDHVTIGRCFIILKCGLSEYIEYVDYTKDGVKKIIGNCDPVEKNYVYPVEIDGETKKYFFTEEKSVKYLTDMGYVRVSDPDEDRLNELKPHFRCKNEIFNDVYEAYIGQIEVE